MIKGAIVLVAFPFDDFSSLKVRPALCLTSEIGKHEHIIVAFISSKIPVELLDSDFVLNQQSQDYKATGLLVESVIRLHRLVTIPKSLIKRKLGTLGESSKKLVINKIKHLIEQ